MIILIDNYDSFIYNIARYVSELGYPVSVFRNDAITLAQIKKRSPQAIIISPGPGFPKDAGISIAIVKKFGETIPILGICLGHQAIAEAYGGKIIQAIEPMHGKSCFISHNQSGIFKNLENPMQVGRYHSLAIERETLPNTLEVISMSSDEEIMAIKHRTNPVYGVQFHPESILTPSGKALLKNFLSETNNP